MKSVYIQSTEFAIAYHTLYVLNKKLIEDDGLKIIKKSVCKSVNTLRCSILPRLQSSVTELTLNEKYKFFRRSRRGVLCDAHVSAGVTTLS